MHALFVVSIATFVLLASIPTALAKQQTMPGVASGGLAVSKAQINIRSRIWRPATDTPSAGKRRSGNVATPHIEGAGHRNSRLIQLAELQAGTDSDQREKAGLPKKYNPMVPEELGRLQTALREICPCLFIFVAGKNYKGNKRRGIKSVAKGEVIIRDPRKPRDDLPAKIRDGNKRTGASSKRVKKQIEKAEKEFCDCYKKHKAGCNLIWKLAQSKHVTTIWKSKIEEGGDDGGNRHKFGHVGWNPVRDKSDKSTTGQMKRPRSVGLAHELTHALHWINLKNPDDHWTKKRREKDRRAGREKEEFAAVRGENQIRAELHAESEDKERKNRGDRKRIAKTHPRHVYSFPWGTKDVPNPDSGDIGLEDLFDCDKKKEEEVGFLVPGGEERPAYAYRVAVQVPEVCVGTTYYVSETSGQTGGLVSTTGGPAVALGGAPAVIISTSPALSISDDPATGETSDGTVPECAKTPTASGTPTSETPIPVTVVKTPPPAESGAPDLGLVKAQESVVSLVVAGGDTGTPVEGAVVKLLGNEPSLPLTETADSALTSTAAYKSDVQAAFTDGSGAVQVASAGTAAAIAVEVVDEPVKKGETSKPTRSHTLKVGEKKIAQFVIAAKPGSTKLKLKPTPAQADLKACVSKSYAIGETPVFVVNLPANKANQFVDAVAQSENVEFFEKDLCRHKEENTDPHFSGSGLWGQEFDNQWAIKRVGFDATKASAWARAGKDLHPVTVAVIDSGLDWYHPDISQASLWRNKGEIPDNGLDDDGNGYIDDIIGWNMIGNNAKPWDHDGHGTFVAGVIVAARNNGKGISGINPAARIMVLKALDAFGQGYGSMIAEAITYAANNGARVINLSLGGRGLTKIEQLAVDYARKKGALLVVAAGNAATAIKGYSPGGLKGVITVAATDRDDRRAGFSNWGPSIDIAAPGIDVLSLRARNTDLLSFIRGVKYEKGKGIVGKDRAYFRASGTSFAAPIVSGTLSLIMSKSPDIDAEKAWRMVLNSARDIATPGIDNFTGYGLLDAAAAVKADPEFYIESRITGVKVFRSQGRPVLQVTGTTNADNFQEATIMVGKGNAPTKWLQLKKSITKAVENGPLMNLPASLFQGAKHWTIRLITKHHNGSMREARFSLKLR